MLLQDEVVFTDSQNLFFLVTEKLQAVVRYAGVGEDERSSENFKKTKQKKTLN